MSKNIQSHLRSETIAELEPPAGLRVGPNQTVRETVAQMQRLRTGCALVCEGTKLVGIFTEQDYTRRISSQGRSLDIPISEVMSMKASTLRASDSVATLIQKFHQGRHRRQPIVDDSGALLGCVSVRNLVRHLAEHFPAAVYKLAPVSKHKQSDREGA